MACEVPALTRRWLLALFLLIPARCSLRFPPKTAAKTKLVVAIIVDQFRYDYMTRFDSAYQDGLRKLHDSGAFFTDAHEAHFPTVTAVGHAAFLSGSTPAIDGIVGNEWFDRETGKTVTSVSDDATKLVGGNGGAGSSPKRLVASTLGDEIKAIGLADTTVIGISLKDRAAILPAGHAANAAYWFEHESGQFVSSTYYMKDLPAWVQAFNKSGAANKYASAKWMPVKTLPAVLGKPYYEAMIATPYGNDMLEAFTEEALKEEHLGQHSGTDVLTVSFSSNDLLGHQVGPDASEVRDMCLQTDRVLGRLLHAVEEEAGAGNYVVVFTSDHGVAPKPEELTKRGIPAGRFSRDQVYQTIEAALTEKYRPGEMDPRQRRAFALFESRSAARETRGAGGGRGDSGRRREKTAVYFRVYTSAQLEHENLSGRFYRDTDGTWLLSRPFSGSVHRSKALLAGVEGRDFAWHAIQLRHARTSYFPGTRNPSGALRRECPHRRYRADAGGVAGSEHAERVGWVEYCR